MTATIPQATRELLRAMVTKANTIWWPESERRFATLEREVARVEFSYKVGYRVFSQV